MAEKSNETTLVVSLLEEINIYEHGVDHRCQLGSVDLQDVKELMFACFLRVNNDTDANPPQWKQEQS